MGGRCWDTVKRTDLFGELVGRESFPATDGAIEIARPLVGDDRRRHEQEGDKEVPGGEDERCRFHRRNGIFQFWDQVSDQLLASSCLPL